MKACRYLTRALLALAMLCVLDSSVCLAAQESSATDPVSPPPASDHPQGPRPIRKGRVFVWDIQGTWISKAYMEKLQSTRSPHAAARHTPSLVVKIEKDGSVFPILITNFQNALLQFLIEVEPGGKPNTYRMVVSPEAGAVSASDVTYIYFRGQRNAQGKFESLSIAEPNFAKKKYLSFVRLADALDPFVNRSVIAGKYHDEQGGAYEFTDAGDAVLPDRKFPYEVALDPAAASCDLLVSHPERAPDAKEKLGFAWKGKQLALFKVTQKSEGRSVCDSKPFALLTPDSTT